VKTRKDVWRQCFRPSFPNPTQLSFSKATWPTGSVTLLNSGRFPVSPTSVSFHLQHGLQAAICERNVLTRSHVSFKDAAALCSWSSRLNIHLWISQRRLKLCLHAVLCAEASPKRERRWNTCWTRDTVTKILRLTWA
jgi:hypothetical protein